MNSSSRATSPIARARRARRLLDRAGFALLLVAIGFQLVFLLPEAWIERAPLNDMVFHRAASERMLGAILDGEPFLDPWVSEWSLGFPVWRSYQPLPHLVGAAWLAGTRWLGDPASSFAVLHLIALVLLPASVFAGARLFGLSRLAAGAAALLAIVPSEAGELGRYGLGAGAFTWRGSGLFTQLIALHALALAIGLSRRALEGRGRSSVAAVALAATALSHIVFAYVAFVSAAIAALVGPAGSRPRRLARLVGLAASALILVAWFYVPLALDLSFVNHSRWEEPYKWDSFGAARILGDLASGRLLDAGRAPVLTLVVAAGAVICALERRRAVARRLLALTATWLVLFFGRTTWGHLVDVLAIPASFHLHRLQGAFELFACLLAAYGIEGGVRRALGSRAALAVLLVVAALGGGLLLHERAASLRENAAWGEASLARLEQERGDVEATLADVRAILAERPGRVSAGKAAGWGRTFVVGSLPFYAILSAEHVDQASFLYHAMSATSDVMVLRDESDLAHDVAFGIRAVVAPAHLPMPPHLRRRAVHGRFAVYESSPEGYFGLVDVAARFAGPAVGKHEVSAAWLRGAELRRGVVFALGGPPGSLPSFGRWQEPPAVATPVTARGSVLSEEKIGERYRARVALARPCHAFVKITYLPGLVATVDGAPAPVVEVTPGFAAVPVPAGVHEVEVRWAPGALKPGLLLAGLVVFALFAIAERAPLAARTEARLTGFAAAIERALARPGACTAAVVGCLVILALHPLFARGLVEGTQARLHPPRLVELGRAIGDGHVPPVWAPDLAAGHGLPLFEFAPLLADAAALVGLALGLRIAESLQLSLVVLFAAGASAVYALARAGGGARSSSVAAVALWIFAPLLSYWLFREAAFAPAAAFAVLPVAWLGVRRATTPAGAAAGAVAVALVVLADRSVAALAIPALAVLAGAGGSDRPARLGGLSAVVGGLFLSAFHWIPALVEGRLVTWPPPSPAVLSAWRLVVPWSSPGLGLAMLFGVAGFALPARTPGRVIRLYGLVAAASAALSLGAAAGIVPPALTSAASALVLPALLLPLLATALFDRIGPTATALLLVAVSALGLAQGSPLGTLSFDDEFYSHRAIAERGMEAAEAGAWRPVHASAASGFTEPGLAAESRAAIVTLRAATTTRREFAVRSSEPVRWHAATFAYPGWSVAIDGIDTPVVVDDATGTMRFDGPAGDHRVTIELHPTPVRRLASLLSAAALLAALAGMVIGARSRPRG